MHKVCAICAFCGSRALTLLLYQPIQKSLWEPIPPLKSAARIGSAWNAASLLKQLHGSWRHAVLDGEHSVIVRAQYLAPPLRKSGAQRQTRLRPEQLEAKLGSLRELLGAVKDASLGYRNAVRR